MGKKKTTSGVQLHTDPNPLDRQGSIRIPYPESISIETSHDQWEIPTALRLRRHRDPGILVGMRDDDNGTYVGIPYGADGNLLVMGGNGSGKSSGVAIPTLETWPGPLCATDIKGELANRYLALHQCGRVSRPCIVADPMDATSPSYDPFWWLSRDKDENLVENAFQMASVLFPVSLEEQDKFWVQSE